MLEAPGHTITRLLHQAGAGDASAREQLYAALYQELKRIARRHLARTGTVSLDAPALLHDAYLHLSAAAPLGEFANRKVFLAYASTVMRHVIIDYVRGRQAQKRGSGERALTLNTGVAESVFAEEKILALHDALSQLEQVDPRGRQVVEMRYFGGLTEQEIAEVLGVSLPTVKRDWRKARAFLFQCLTTVS